MKTSFSNSKKYKGTESEYLTSYSDSELSALMLLIRMNFLFFDLRMDAKDVICEIGEEFKIIFTLLLF
jgi:hypothetical protein